MLNYCKIICFFSLSQQKTYDFAQLAAENKKKTWKLCQVCFFTYFCSLLSASTPGLTGFDSRMRCCVSTQRVDNRSLKSMIVKDYLAKETTLSLPNRSIVDYWLYPGTRCWDEMSLWSCCSEASRQSGTAKSEIAHNGLAWWVKFMRIRCGLVAQVLSALEKRRLG